MKLISILLAIWVIGTPVTAQKTIEKHINFAGKESLVLNIRIADSILVHTWNKPEVYAQASVNINDNKDNEAYRMSFDESGKVVSISADFAENYFKNSNYCCIESEIIWSLYIPEKTVFSIETINGNIVVDGVTTEIKAKSISGIIDLAMMQDRKADLELKTISGTFYSDLDLNPGAITRDLPQIVRQKINSGGYTVHLETISGDIFVRKSKL